MIELLLLLWNVRSGLQMVAFAVLVVLALRFGAGPERAVAFIIGQMPVIDALYHAMFQSTARLYEVELGHLMIDLVTAIALIFIALQANRMYTLWIGSFQLVALQAHLIRELVSEVSPIAYFTMQTLPSYFQILVLAIGLCLHHRRQLQYGRYRDWRNFSCLSSLIARRNLQTA